MRRSALVALLLALIAPLTALGCAEASTPRSTTTAPAARAAGGLKVVLKTPAGLPATVKFKGPQRFHVSKPAAGTMTVTRKRVRTGTYVVSAQARRVGVHLYQPNFTKKTVRIGRKSRVVVRWSKVILRKLTNGQGDSLSSSLSQDGRWLAFASSAPHLVAGEKSSNGDIFVVDNATGRIRRITSGNAPSLNPTISANGRVVVFESYATNLVAGDTNRAVDIFAFDLISGRMTRVSRTATGDSSEASVSADGSKIVYTSYDPSAQVTNLYLYNAALGLSVPITHGDGSSLGGQISADGSTVVFASLATNLVLGDHDNNGQTDIFKYSTTVPLVTRVTGAQSNGNSLSPVVSANGQWVAFSSSANNLVPGDGNRVDDVFLTDVTTGTTTRITNGNDISGTPSISADGRYLAFESMASNLAPGDTNNRTDVFFYDNATHAIQEVTHGRENSSDPSISADGKLVSFSSVAANLVPGDHEAIYSDVFFWDR